MAQKLIYPPIPDLIPASSSDSCCPGWVCDVGLYLISPGAHQGDSCCPGWMCNMGLYLISREIPDESKCLAANRQLCSSSCSCAGSRESMAAESVSGFGAGP